MGTHKVIEYMCTHCGKRELRDERQGRPSPGACPKRTERQPHRWVKNRIVSGGK